MIFNAEEYSKTEKKQNRNHKSKDELIKEIEMLYDGAIETIQVYMESLYNEQRQVKLIEARLNFLILTFQIFVEYFQSKIEIIKNIEDFLNEKKLLRH